MLIFVERVFIIIYYCFLLSERASECVCVCASIIGEHEMHRIASDKKFKFVQDSI